MLPYGPCDRNRTDNLLIKSQLRYLLRHTGLVRKFLIYRANPEPYGIQSDTRVYLVSCHSPVDEIMVRDESFELPTFGV